MFHPHYWFVIKKKKRNGNRLKNDYVVKSEIFVQNSDIYITITIKIIETYYYCDIKIF